MLFLQKLKNQIENVMADIQDFKSSVNSLVCQIKMLEREKRFCSGKKKFNMDPKKVRSHSASNLIVYLILEDMHLRILKAFVELHEFSDLNLVQALRQFLWSFRLPGEAQKIDRMMEAFATRYCNCNANVFQSTDTCYILSFAIIMLNTSLHNPNVKDKTSLERFISMNRGINNGQDLPDELLTVSSHYFILYTVAYNK
uniref:Cytohesin 4b n=1 Tax=Sinocyclocheilus rhinocerous TaxID=307959 RepID=A0A673M7V7_9TELE